MKEMNINHFTFIVAFGAGLYYWMILNDVSGVVMCCTLMIFSRLNDMDKK